jgi:hypothetical protein
VMGREEGTTVSSSTYTAESGRHLDKPSGWGGVGGH